MYIRNFLLRADNVRQKLSMMNEDATHPISIILSIFKAMLCLAKIDKDAANKTYPYNLIKQVWFHILPKLQLFVQREMG